MNSNTPRKDLPANTPLSHYRVVSKIGAGGMGEVYLAEDTRLDRKVAIKLLPSDYARDADRVRRFEQEAKATTALNHPNILTVYDIGTHEGAPYIVAELLEGETLRDRIGGAPLPTRKAIDLATQVARGLSAAHEKGIVHRDLKPENLFITRDGRLKILDFGLAKLTDGAALTEAETNTHGAPATGAGQMLGTVGYMSPEQVRARPVDHRSDIFSFGSVLYEMLTGKRAFRGASAVETMNAILKDDPEVLTETNRSLPAALERIVSHCLEKNPEERFQSARDIAFDLEHLSGSETTHAALAVAEGRFRSGRRGLALALAALALGAGAFVAGRRSVAQGSLPDFRAITFQRGDVSEARFAADGKSIIYSARWSDAAPNIYVAQAGSPESRSLDLKDAVLASVSPTGELAVSVGRGTGPGDTLARLPVGGGAPRDVTEHVSNADWGPDGASFAVVRAGGGKNVIEFPIGRPLYSAVYLDNLRVSPRGDLVAFSDHPVSGDNRGDVAVVDLSGRKRILSTNWSDIRGLAWSPDGREVWFTASRSGIELSLWGVTLDGRERQVYRAPGSLRIQDTAPGGRVLLSVAQGKPSLLGMAPGETKERDLSWLDWGWATDLSTDGKVFLFGEQGDGGGHEYAVYIRGTDGSAPTLLGPGAAAALSPDGRSALVLSLSPPAHFMLLPTGAGETRLLPRGSLAQFEGGAFFPDGKRIAFAGNEEGKATRVWVQDLGGGEPRAISTEGVSGGGASLGFAISPDSAFIAARSDAGPVLYPLAGGEPQVVNGAEASDRPLRFSANGQYLYVRSFQRGQGSRPPARIFRVDLAKGRRELWKEIAPAGASILGTITSLVIAPEAGSYAFTYFEPTSTLYEVRGLR